MKKHTLQGLKRTVSGRKVKKLRANGDIPATIYGKKFVSMSVTVGQPAFEKVYKEAGETGLIELTVDSIAHPVLIHNVQLDPVSEALLHVEFYQVDLKEKVKTKVPVVVVGESPAVGERRGVILALLSEIEVEALPAELPEKIEVDVSGLSDVDQEIKVSEVKVSPQVTILTDGGLGVVKVGSLVTKEAEAQAAAEAAEAAAASTEAAPAEGEAPAAEATKTEENPQDKSTEETKAS